MKKLTKAAMNAMASAALKTAKRSAGSACESFVYQPKAPKNLTERLSKM